MKILHVITTTTHGGAEHALRRVLSPLRDLGVHSHIVSLAPPGPVADLIRADGFPLSSLHLKPNRPSPKKLHRLLDIIRSSEPDVVQTWMVHADLAAAPLARSLGIPLVWTLRRTETYSDDSTLTRLLAAVASRASRRLPHAVIACSHATRRVHAQLGYPPNSIRVVHNGYSPHDVPRLPTHALRRELGAPPTLPLIGRVARFELFKDTPTLASALQLLSSHHPNWRLVLWGEDMVDSNTELTDLLRFHSIRERTHLLGLRHDTRSLYGDLDVIVSSSAWGEGFPNTLAEAMLAGVPAVATDVGDSALIVGSRGKVVPPADPPALAESIASVLDDDNLQSRRGRTATRHSIIQRFPIEHMARGFAHVYQGIVPSYLHPGEEA